MRPALSTASTISGSGLFQAESERTPIQSPQPTDDSVGALVKISASGPIATSRYCDHRPSAISAALSFFASSEPGFTERMSAPMRSRKLARRLSALLASPRQRSSITRSMAEIANVTPLALMHCRSKGESSRTSFAPANSTREAEGFQRTEIGARRARRRSSH